MATRASASVTVDPLGVGLSVGITIGGVDAAPMTTRNGSTPISLPAAISTPTTFWLPPAEYVVTVTLNSSVVAQETVRIDGAAHVTVTPALDFTETASLIGNGLGAVASVNSQTGDVTLDAAAVGADPTGTAAGLVGALDAAAVGADPAGTAAGLIDNTAYDAATWNGDTTHAPTKDAVRDKIESLSGASGQSPWQGPYKVSVFNGQQFTSPLGVGGTPPDGGTYTITVDGDTTTALAFDANAAAVQAALEALGSVGVGHVTVTDDSGTFDVSFHGVLIAALVTLNAASLTGADAPYTLDKQGASSLTPLFTPAVGDIIEDFLHTCPTAFAEGGQLVYTDDPDGPAGAAPAWTAPSSFITGLTLDTATSYTNFGAINDTTPGYSPTALLGEIDAAIARQAGAGHASQGTDLHLPAPVLTAVPIYAYVSNVDPAPTEGEVWIWAKVSAPTAPV